MTNRYNLKKNKKNCNLLKFDNHISLLLNNLINPI